MELCFFLYDGWLPLKIGNVVVQSDRRKTAAATEDIRFTSDWDIPGT